ncbi:hypothetical protein Pan161_57870 [Gimesia algae]|uniref:Uncharacterized protein n=1 Tax=Gimesia algae TaxID=2527971 RepID=A0A517VM60_9PLAN|nr:hypothetical protein Pan161_57870 [Gimesia algae]
MTQIGALLSWFLVEGCLSGSSALQCLRIEDPRDRRSPVKAISRDTGVILAETVPLRNEDGMNCVDPQLFELLIGNRWQRRLDQWRFTGGLLWCSAAQVRNISLLVELDTRATQFSAVSRIAAASQAKYFRLLLFSGFEEAAGMWLSQTYGFSGKRCEYLKFQSAKLSYQTFSCFSDSSGCV